MTEPTPTTSQVRVGVRVRPLASKEIQQGGKISPAVVPPSISIGQRKFTYDDVFDSNVEQAELYDNVSTPLLKSFVDGYNATIMAYGQTGSGKTFTMGSEALTQPDGSSQVGLIPRFIGDFFQQMQRKKDTSDEGQEGAPVLLEYNMRASFLEVYGEDVFDLLDSDRKSLPLREDSGGGVVISGLTSRPISNPAEALQVLHEGTMNRTTAATLMNLTSSRSHAVFTIYLSQVTRSDDCKDVDVSSISKFTFVDLAGSERMKKTGAEGERAREGIKINEGLLALGNVINALADEERMAKDKRIHVPYRQSKLTRLLQDALGGNSQTLFLACVSPSDTNVSETLSTLHYANRARNIRNAPTKNVDATAAELQRLHTLTRILQCELVKARFQESLGAEEEIGHVETSLMKRSDVEEYINLIHRTANEVSGTGGAPPSLFQAPSVQSTPISLDFPPPIPEIKDSASPHVLDATPNKTISERFDDSFLIDVNPDEDMAILDQLLELQQHDHEYDKAKKSDDEKLKRMTGELEKEEAMLLRLRESLKVYHSLKTKYEELMAEVQQLEVEKAVLADQLEKATVDPSTGCSSEIKRRLEKVELSLSRARRETLSHRQKYKRSEEQAKKSRVLERKIADLKQAKATLVKKQKEAATRYKETSEAKTKELLTLRRKEKAAETTMTKLKTEMQHHKSNLEKRKNYCSKLSEKLKQTESHLMKLLTMRQRELVDRASLSCGNRKDTGNIASDRSEKQCKQKSKAFTLSNEDLKSSKFILDKMVWDRVDQAHLQNQYEERVATYSDTMRKVVSEVKSLNKARERLKHEKTDEAKGTVQELEESVADLELKLELWGSDLKEIRSKMPEESKHSMLDGDEAVKKMMSTMNTQVLRTMLMETFSKLVEAETERKTYMESIDRKDAALLSFESEVEALNSKVASLAKDLTDRRVLLESGEDALEVFKCLNTEKSTLSEKLGESQKALDEANTTVRDHGMRLEKAERELAKAKEDLVLAEASLAKHGGNVESKGTMGRLQEVWGALGLNMASRERDRDEIQSSLTDTCARKLDEALKLKAETEREIDDLTFRLESMQNALGIVAEVGIGQHSSKILEHVRALRKQVQELETPYKYASARRERIISDTIDLSAALGLSPDQLPSNLGTLIHQVGKVRPPGARIGRQRRASMMEDVKTLVEALSSKFENQNGSGGIDEDDQESAPDADSSDEELLKLPQNCLESEFLSGCENDVAVLRVQKSEILVKSREMQQDISVLVRDMHMSTHDLVALVEHNMKSKQTEIPAWWETERAEAMVRAVATPTHQIEVLATDTKHLGVIHESLCCVANCRRSLSAVFRTIVERAQESLLDIVGRELDASEAYASFHDALFRLPPLSKDLSLACISEMEALVSGVEAMTQSEIEALTVVWEALSVSSEARRNFWGRVDNPDSTLEITKVAPFDELEESLLPNAEDWIVAAVEEGARVYRDLDANLSKLGGIHSEVEKLRSKQDTKSQVLSLDSEIRILNAKLQDFEELQCSKQRLLNKKISGSALLKEERFRKQMQGKFVSKLGQLASLLRSWEKEERQSFDSSLLSDDVRMLLDEPGKMQNWVEKRTKLMPLRTVQTQTPRKRPLEAAAPKSSAGNRLPSSRAISGRTPPRKRVAKSTSQAVQLSKSKTEHSLLSRPGREHKRAVPVAKKRKLFSDSPKVLREKEMQSSPVRPKASKSRRKQSTARPPFGHVLSELASPRSDVKENTKM